MSVRVIMIIEVADEYADPDHEMGVTEEANLQLGELIGLGEIIDGPTRTRRESLNEVEIGGV